MQETAEATPQESSRDVAANGAVLLPAVLVSDQEPVDEQLKTKPLLPGIADPRSERAAVSTSKIGVIGFYYPDRPEPVDKLCNAGFLGNFWNTEAFGGRIAVAKNAVRKKEPTEKHIQMLRDKPSFAAQFDEVYGEGVAEAILSEGADSAIGASSAVAFTNAEAAFQALKFWRIARDFEKLSGEKAFKLKRSLKGQEDFTYAGYGSNWAGMMAVLEAKFKPGSPMAQALKMTGDSFLLEHNSVQGRDNIWSNNNDGTGKNWLGMQLMLLRDRLTGATDWTNWIEAQIDLQTGAPRGTDWQSSVQHATDVVNAALQKADAKATGAPTLVERFDIEPVSDFTTR